MLTIKLCNHLFRKSFAEHFILLKNLHSALQIILVEVILEYLVHLFLSNLGSVEKWARQAKSLFFQNNFCDFSWRHIVFLRKIFVPWIEIGWLFIFRNLSRTFMLNFGFQIMSITHYKVFKFRIKQWFLFWLV